MTSWGNVERGPTLGALHDLLEHGRVGVAHRCERLLRLVWLVVVVEFNIEVARG